MRYSGNWLIVATVSFGAIWLAGGALAGQDDDDLKALLADCERPGLQSSDIDDCMERARVLDETRPSPRLQSLLARLERLLESGGDDASAPSPPPPAGTAPHMQAEEPRAVPSYAKPDDPAAASGDIANRAQEVDDTPPDELQSPDDGPAPSEDDMDKTKATPKTPAHEQLR